MYLIIRILKVGEFPICQGCKKLVMEYSTDPECSNHLVPFNIVPDVNYQGAGCTLIGHIYPHYRELMYLFWLYLPPSWITRGPSADDTQWQAVNHCKASIDLSE